MLQYDYTNHLKVFSPKIAEKRYGGEFAWCFCFMQISIKLFSNISDAKNFGGQELFEFFRPSFFLFILYIRF